MFEAITFFTLDSVSMTMSTMLNLKSFIHILCAMAKAEEEEKYDEEESSDEESDDGDSGIESDSGDPETKDLGNLYEKTDVDKNKLFAKEASPCEFDTKLVEDPHQAWVGETGKGGFEEDFQEAAETLYLVFWYWLMHNFLI